MGFSTSKFQILLQHRKKFILQHRIKSQSIDKATLSSIIVRAEITV